MIRGRTQAWVVFAGLIVSLVATEHVMGPRTSGARSVEPWFKQFEKPERLRSDLMRTVSRLADPKLEGRGIGTTGIDSAATYIAGLMRSMSLLPGGDDGSYFQSFEVTTGVAVGEPGGISVGRQRFAVGDDVQPLGFSANGTLKTPVVFAGYGITAPGFDYDDYDGIDVRDKLVLVLSQEPGEMDSTSRFNGNVNTAHAELRTKAINAREHGALGLLIVDGPRHHVGEPLRAPRADGAGYMTSGVLAARVSGRVADALLHSSGATLAGLQDVIDRHERPHPLALRDSVTMTVTLKRTRAKTSNVVGWIPGQDTSRTIVIGAHYDHLGYGGESSLAPDARQPHVGADDNASGVAVMLTVAAHFRGWGIQPRHNLVFCAFTGEESGLLGSGHFVDQPTRPLETIEAMINFDMVGRLRDRKLLIMGAGTAAEFPRLLEHVNRTYPGGPTFDLKTASDGFGPSDHTSFYKRKVPVLHFFTGAHADYHKPTDTPDKLNAEGMRLVSAFAATLVDSLQARPRVTYLQAKADSSLGRMTGGGGYGAYLGTIPDYLQTEGGVKLSGVRAGGPAERAGLKAEDVIVKFDGVRVDNIYDYTFALRSRKPGQTVRITLLRAGSEKELLATLERRP
ncbi:MAG TPA: M20/M25/M40 family metallo-hydrolase [Candidatus Limnocylindria bacterium]|nr:M20/M25/M40 family metallo-hydrolase [Candidatus Limnocylindria bacterium]